MNLTQLLRSRLVRDERCQARAEFNHDHAEQIAEYLQAGGHVPPVIVFRGPDGDVLADGFHRDYACDLTDPIRRYVEADVRPGTLRDAILFAVGANAIHTALTRTNADKRKAVWILIEDPEWGQWSAREIARRVGVSYELVNRMREDYAAKLSDSKCQIEDGGVKVQRNGTTFKMKFRDMNPTEQRTAVQDETDHCRLAWLREARSHGEEMVRTLHCLDLQTCADTVRIVLNQLPAR